MKGPINLALSTSHFNGFHFGGGLGYFLSVLPNSIQMELYRLLDQDQGFLTGCPCGYTTRQIRDMSAPGIFPLFNDDSILHWM